VDSGIRRRHLCYIHNILENYHFTSESLQASLFYIEASGRMELINKVYDSQNIDEDGFREDNKEDCLERIHDLADLGRYLLEDFSAGNLLVDEEELRDLLLHRVERQQQRTGKGKDDLDRRVEELASIFRFNREEKEILTALYAVYEVQNDMLENMTDDMEYHDFIRFMSVITGISYGNVKRIISRKGSLYRSGIISRYDHQGRNFVDFEERIAEYLAGIGDISLTERFIRRDKGSILPLEYFDIPDASLETIQALLKDDKPCNILLGGVAGTGKTEFARSVSRATGKPVFTLNVGGTERNRAMSLKHDEENAMYVSFRAAEELVNTAGGILIADEMDVMLNYAEKGWLNLYIDTSRAKTIWITNTVRRVEESTMRRFNYVEHFEKLTSRDREKIWENILKASPVKKLIRREEIRRLSREHPVNAGGIAHALSNIERMQDTSSLTRQEVLERLNHLLDRHRQQITKNFGLRVSILNSLEANYDLSALNMSVPAEETLFALKDFSAALLGGHVREGNINMLFSGQPGTGKTEFVKYLARETGLELSVKRYSDLESYLVGETEKNIAAAFREARRERAILFIDEADSLFTSRESARTSWEVSRTNEFLTQMENFTGILVCCTNFMPQMDSAAMRRFSWKVEFRAMVQEKRLELYRSFFSFVPGRLSQKLRHRIRSIEGLTPGDLKTVRERVKYRPQDECTHRDVIQALESEQAFKNRESVGKVGF
jgi:AAA+ superfamily predicted ATPase